jgi:AcrR family transcriptional regulator
MSRPPAAQHAPAAPAAEPIAARRDRADTEARLLAAAAEILAEQGFAGFSLAAVAGRACCDRKLVTRYFGGPEGLLDALAGDLGFWIGDADDAPPEGSYAGRVATLLARYRGRLRADPLLKRVLAQELVEPGPALAGIEARRSRAMGDWMEAMRGDARPPAGVDAAAVNAVLLAATHYLALREDAVGSFAGIDLTTEQGRARIDAAIDRLLALGLSGQAQS